LKSSLIRVEPQKYGKIGIVGDLHGDYQTLQALLKIVDLDADLLVFLGDYADRGSDGIEVIRNVTQIRKHHPDSIVALMGNHEDYSDTGNPNFSPCTLIQEATTKLGNWGTYFSEELKPFIESLPLCCLIPNNALLVHGGVSSKLTDAAALESPSEDLQMDLLWSDPFEGQGEDLNYSRGAGVAFGSDVSAAICQHLEVKRIIRSHQPQLATTKPHIMHNGRVITVNTTTVYGGSPFIYFVDPQSARQDYYQNI
jgi:diadenosine tetraphosphatase ApaH/serine/threonine PP2A family protein phosphatase